MDANWSNVVYYAVIELIVLFALTGLFVLGKRLLDFMKSKADKPEEEMGEIVQSVKRLDKVLADAEQDSNRAGVLLSDAETCAGQLVKLIQGIALKAEDMAAEMETLNQALAAIAARDPLQVAQAAGRVRDDHVRTLMLCNIRNEEYWQDTAMLISAQIGVLAQWEAGYRKFTGNLLAEVSQAKARAAGLTAALELTGASRPLLQIQARLHEANQALQLRDRPGLYKATKELPSVNSGLLLK